MSPLFRPRSSVRDVRAYTPKGKHSATSYTALYTQTVHEIYWKCGVSCSNHLTRDHAETFKPKLIAKHNGDTGPKQGHRNFIPFTYVIDTFEPKTSVSIAGIHWPKDWHTPVLSVLGRVQSQELCKSRGGRPGLPVPNSLYGLCGRKPH